MTGRCGLCADGCSKVIAVQLLNKEVDDPRNSDNPPFIQTVFLADNPLPVVSIISTGSRWFAHWKAADGLPISGAWEIKGAENLCLFFGSIVVTLPLIYRIFANYLFWGRFFGYPILDIAATGLVLWMMKSRHRKCEVGAARSVRLGVGVSIPKWINFHGEESRHKGSSRFWGFWDMTHSILFGLCETRIIIINFPTTIAIDMGYVPFSGTSDFVFCFLVLWTTFRTKTYGRFRPLAPP